MGWLELQYASNDESIAALGRSNAVEFVDYEVPTNPRLALTGNQNEML